MKKSVVANPEKEIIKASLKERVRSGQKNKTNVFRSSVLEKMGQEHQKNNR